MEVMASIAVGGGLTIAAAGFAGHYVLQATQNLRWKQFPKASGGLYRARCEPEMTKQEAVLKLGEGRVETFTEELGS